MNSERPDDSRRREDAAIRTEQRLLDFLETYKEDKEITATWRLHHDLAHQESQNDLNKRLKPLEDMRDIVQRPARLIGGIAILMATPVLGVFGFKIWKWLLSVFGNQ